MKTLRLALILAFAFATTTLRAVVLINFDSFADGEQDSNFLASYGIPTITYSGAAGARGPAVTSNLGNSIAPSPPKIFYQYAVANDQNQPHILTFTFSPVLTAFSLDRVGKNGGGSTDTWHADRNDGRAVIAPRQCAGADLQLHRACGTDDRADGSRLGVDGLCDERDDPSG